MQNEKTHENPPPISGGYGRRLKKEESAKGFTLVELIVVIVILAILAAILIPGLLKWIDQAKDKKYELEAREIALAAEAALTKMYAQGAGVSVSGGLLEVGGTTDLAGVDAFQDELEKFTDAEVTGIEIYGEPDAGSSWGGSVSGFEITFRPSGETEPITASLLPGTNRWVIGDPSGGPGGESGDELDAFDDHPDLHVREANAIAKAAKAALAKVYADGGEEMYIGHYVGWICHGDNGYNNNIMNLPALAQEIAELTGFDVENIKFIEAYGKGWNSEDYAGNERDWDGSVCGFSMSFVSSDNDKIKAYYQSGPEINWWGSIYNTPTDGWVIEVNPKYWP